MTNSSGMRTGQDELAVNVHAGLRWPVLDAFRPAVLVLAGILLCAGPIQAMAESKIYFTDANNGGSAVAKVLRADLDGANVELLVTPPSLNPRFIAIDVANGEMYWTDIGSVRRANLDGTNVVNNLVTGPLGPMGIALDLPGGKIYWTDNATGKIQRSDIDGFNIEDVITGLGAPRGLALDLGAGKMYWTDTATDKIQRANLDGSGQEDLVTGQIFPQGIALDVQGGRMYWGNDGRIWSAKLDGTDAQSFVVSGSPIGVAIDIGAQKIYWTDAQQDKVRRANLNGSSVEDLIVTDLDTPWGIALDVQDSVDVSIDIKPDSSQNTINLGSAGVIPIAILSSDTFDALTVNEETIWVNAANVRVAGNSENFLCQVRDVNGDGLDDLVCDVETADIMIVPGEDSLELTAETDEGVPIQGTDFIQIVP